LSKNLIFTYTLMLSSLILVPSVGAQLPLITHISSEREVLYTRAIVSESVDGTSSSESITTGGSIVVFPGPFNASIDGADFVGGIFQPALLPAASQTSNIGGSSITGSGFQDAFVVADSSATTLSEITDEGRSSFLAVFELTEPVQFSFDATTTGFSEVSLLSIARFFEVSLSGSSLADDPLSVGGSSGLGFDQSLSESGVLEAGEYVLTANFFSTGFDADFNESSFDFDFRVSAVSVPEPSTLALLLGAALAGVATRRRAARA